MTNRKQVAWAFAFSEYDAREVAEIVADMLDAASVAYMDHHDCERLAAWLDLKCDPETNNWGTFPEPDEEGEEEE